MKTLIKAAAAASVAGVLALTGCSATGASSNSALSVVGYSVLEAANKPVFADFQDTSVGKGVEFRTSYGASGDQSRAVDGGLKADVVHFSLETDVTRLVDSGLVDKSWKDTPTKGIATSSVVVLVVRKGNPDHITGWDDIVKPGVEVITPNPGSSGSARWNILAAWEHIAGNGGTDAQAKTFLTKLLKNTIALPSSGRDATTSFTAGNGDVLLSYENEAILAKQGGADVDYVVPDDTLLIENPAAVTKAASSKAKAFLKFLTSTKGQEDYAKSGFRPVVDGVKIPQVEGANDPSDPFPTPEKLFTVDQDLGGWAEAAKKFFNDGEDGNPLGIVPQLQEETGKQGEQ
jgi:sulfate transport system substrate-binding protein